MALQTEQAAMRVVDPGVSRLLTKARLSAQRGEARTAHSLYAQATRLDPSSVEAWLGRSEQTTNFDEQLFCLSQVVSIVPDHPAANQKLYMMLRSMLDQEPALVYIDESERLYRVRNNTYTSLAVPKARFPNNNLPEETSEPVQKSYRWLVLAFFGLALAGIGSLIIAPVAIFTAVYALLQPLKKSDHIRAVLALGLSALIWAISIPLAYLFYLHVMP